MSKRKSPTRPKPKAASQKERIHLWKEHFKDLLGKYPKITDKPIMKIINNKLDVELGQFTQDVVLTKIKNKETAGLDEIPPEV